MTSYLFAAELEETKIGMRGKGLMHHKYVLNTFFQCMAHVTFILEKKKIDEIK